MEGCSARLEFFLALLRGGAFSFLGGESTEGGAWTSPCADAVPLRDPVLCLKCTPDFDTSDFAPRLRTGRLVAAGVAVSADASGMDAPAGVDADLVTGVGALADFGVVVLALEGRTWWRKHIFLPGTAATGQCHELLLFEQTPAVRHATKSSFRQQHRQPFVVRWARYGMVWHITVWHTWKHSLNDETVAGINFKKIKHRLKVGTHQLALLARAPPVCRLTLRTWTSTNLHYGPPTKSSLRQQHRQPTVGRWT